MLISGVSFHHRSLLQSHDSNVLSLFRMQNSQNFPGLCACTPLGRAYSNPLPSPPFLRLPSCTTVFLLATLIGKLTPPKNCWIRHWLYPLLSSLASIISLTELNKSYSYWITLKNWFLSFWIIFKLYFYKKLHLLPPTHLLKGVYINKQLRDIMNLHQCTKNYDHIFGCRVMARANTNKKIGLV